MKTGDLINLKLVPVQIHKFRLQHASKTDAEWLHAMLNREREQFGTHFRFEDDKSISLRRDKISHSWFVRTRTMAEAFVPLSKTCELRNDACMSHCEGMKSTSL